MLTKHLKKKKKDVFLTNELDDSNENNKELINNKEKTHKMKSPLNKFMENQLKSNHSNDKNIFHHTEENNSDSDNEKETQTITLEHGNDWINNILTIINDNNELKLAEIYEQGFLIMMEENNMKTSRNTDR